MILRRVKNLFLGRIQVSPLKIFIMKDKISVMGFDGKYWSGNSVDSMSDAWYEARRFVSLGDTNWRITNPNSGEIYISDESVREYVILTARHNFPEVANWNVRIGFH